MAGFNFINYDTDAPTVNIKVFTVFPRIIAGRGAIISFFSSIGGYYSRKGDYFLYCSLEVVP